jgi:hypothetical protein
MNNLDEMTNRAKRILRWYILQSSVVKFDNDNKTELDDAIDTIIGVAVEQAKAEIREEMKAEIARAKSELKFNI